MYLFYVVNLVRFIIILPSMEQHNLNGQGYFQVESYFIWPDGSGEVLEQDCITCQ
ncbi:unnamed protein product, partial [Rotaria magnacalcarata]